MILPDGPVREAGPEDAGTLAAFRVEFLRTVKTLDDAAAAEIFADQKAMFAEEIGEGRMHAWIFESGGRALGSCALLPGRGSGRGGRRPERVGARGGAAGAEPGGSAELAAVYTVPDRRREGIASLLVAAAVARARGLGLASLGLQPTDDSRRLYQSFGFRPSDGRMELTLSESENADPVRLPDAG